MPHSVDPRLGVRSLLPPQQCLHYAGVPRAPFQPPVRRLSGGHLDHRVHLHQDLRTALRRERGPGTRRGLEAVGDGGGFGDRHGNLHGRRRLGRGHLHGHSPNANSHHGRCRADRHRVDARWRLGASPHYGAARLFPHDQTGVGFQLSLDRHLFRRPDSWHLVLVHRSGHRPTRVVCPR